MNQIPLVLGNGMPLCATPSRMLCIAEAHAPASDIVGYVGGDACLPVEMGDPHLVSDDGDVEVLSHIATFPLAALDGVVPGLPEGSLALLYAMEEQPWTYVCHDVTGARTDTDSMAGMQNGHRVVFIPAGAETRPVRGGATYPRRDLVMRDGVILDLANESDLMALEDDDMDELDSICQDVRRASFGDGHEAVLVQGPIENIQGDILPELPELGEVVRGLAGTTEKDWVCIAQVSSLGCDYQPKVKHSFEFGDCGVLYFCITREDLAAMRFDRTICILQCD